jgi:aspartyl-tRNA(Asn)/glutamyl-tRNA(Gln) amidotransferase subunit A
MAAHAIDVRYVADLARVQLDDAEVRTFEGQLGAILGYVEKLAELDVEGIEPEAAEADLSLPLGGIPIAIKDNINVHRPALHLRLEVSRRKLQVALRRHRRPQAPRRRSHPLRPDESGRIRDGLLHRKLRLADHPQPARSGTHSRRFLRRIGRRGRRSNAVAALGSDTGGSIRQPASHCGVVGLKPSYGRVSRYGLVAFASSLDQIGPLTRSVEDAAIILQAIAGFDPLDSTCLDVPVPDYLSGTQRRCEGMKLGVPKEYFGDGIDPAVRARSSAAIQQLAAKGAEIVEISLPAHRVRGGHLLRHRAGRGVVQPVALRRHPLRPPHANPADILDLYKKSRDEGFGPEVKRRIILGTYVLSSGYYDAYYGRAQKVRTLIRRDFEQAFQQVDAILSRSPPPRHGKSAPSPTIRCTSISRIFSRFPPTSPASAGCRSPPAKSMPMAAPQAAGRIASPRPAPRRGHDSARRPRGGTTPAVRQPSGGDHSSPPAARFVFVRAVIRVARKMLCSTVRPRSTTRPLTSTRIPGWIALSSERRPLTTTRAVSSTRYILPPTVMLSSSTLVTTGNLDAAPLNVVIPDDEPPHPPPPQPPARQGSPSRPTHNTTSAAAKPPRERMLVCCFITAHNYPPRNQRSSGLRRPARIPRSASEREIA